MVGAGQLVRLRATAVQRHDADMERWIMDLRTMTDDELFEVTVEAISAAAAGEAQGGDDATYDRAMDLMAESQRRTIESGHKGRCRTGVYNRAFEKALAAHSGHAPQSPACTCADEATR